MKINNILFTIILILVLLAISISYTEIRIKSVLKQQNSIAIDVIGLNSKLSIIEKSLHGGEFSNKHYFTYLVKDLTEKLRKYPKRTYLYYYLFVYSNNQEIKDYMSSHKSVYRELLTRMINKIKFSELSFQEYDLLINLLQTYSELDKEFSDNNSSKLTALKEMYKQRIDR